MDNISKADNETMLFKQHPVLRTNEGKVRLFAGISARNFADVKYTFLAGLQSTNCLHEVRVAV